MFCKDKTKIKRIQDAIAVAMVRRFEYLFYLVPADGKSNGN